MPDLRKYYGVCTLAVCWELISRLELLPSHFFPPLSVVLLNLWDMLGATDFWRDELLTVSRTLSGVSLAVILGASLALGCAKSKTTFAMLSPIIEFIRPIPPAAMIPLAIFFVGIGPGLFLFTITFASVWPIYISTANALGSVDRVLVDTSRSLGCSRFEELIKIQIPHALPQVFTGLRVGAGVALLATIVVEMLVGRGGIGYILYDSAFSLQVPRMFAGMIVAGVNGVLLNLLIGKLRLLCIGWHIEMSRETSGSEQIQVWS